MNKLNILWTTTNKDTIFKMISMYAINAKKNKWWDEIDVIIWGGSAKLVGEDTQVQTEVLEMLNQGINVKACLACADSFGVTDVFRKLGVTVEYMGEPLTQALKNNEKILTL